MKSDILFTFVTGLFEFLKLERGDFESFPFFITFRFRSLSLDMFVLLFIDY